MPKPLQTQTRPTDADIRLQLERILASRTFSHAQRLRTMLRFLVEQTLE